MTGNVSEWCRTDFYSGSSDIRAEAQERVIRGGSWWDPFPNMLTVSARGRHQPGHTDDKIGFRLATFAR